MNPADQGADNPIVNGLRSFSQSGSPVGNMIGLGLALTGQTQGPVSTPTGDATDSAVANGLSSLAKEYSKTNDPARSVINWVQSPEGIATAKVPGALKKTLDQFREQLQPLNVTGANIPQGATGVINQGGAGGVSGIRQPTPQVNNVPPNNQAVITGPGSATMGPRTPGSDVQNFKDFAGLSNLPDSTLSQIAGLKTTNDDFQRRYALGANMLQQGADPHWVQAWQNGTIQMYKDDKVPNMYHWVDQIGDPTHMHTVMSQVEGADGQTPSIAPTWNNNLKSANPEGYHAPGPEMTGTNGVPNQSAAVQQTAQKYQVPPEAIRPDGTIDPVKAWGPAGTYALGGGLPAMAQNLTAHLTRWFDPTATSEGSETVIQAEQGLQALQYMSTNLAEGSRVKVMVDAALGMGPEHEKFDDPASAAGQMIVMRRTLEGEARSIQDQVKGMKLEGVQADNSAVTQATEKLFAIQKVLEFLPATSVLTAEKKAIQDGKVAVPSVSSAAREGAGLVSKAIGTATGTSGQANSGQQVMEQIAAAKKPGDLKSLVQQYGSLDPQAQSAIDDKLRELRAGAKPKAAPAKAQAHPQFAPAKPFQSFGAGQTASPGNPFSGL